MEEVVQWYPWALSTIDAQTAYTVEAGRSAVVTAKNAPNELPREREENGQHFQFCQQQKNTTKAKTCQDFLAFYSLWKHIGPRCRCGCLSINFRMPAIVYDVTRCYLCLSFDSHIKYYSTQKKWKNLAKSETREKKRISISAVVGFSRRSRINFNFSHEKHQQNMCEQQ